MRDFESYQADFFLLALKPVLATSSDKRKFHFNIFVQEHGLEDEIINMLRRADAAHHIPSFARHKVTSANVMYLTDKQLQSIGVFEVGLRQNILR